MAVSSSEGNPLLAAAIAYAELGWRVVPLHQVLPATSGPPGCSCGKPNCESQGKHPRVRDWPKAASADAGTIRNWWQRWPQANVGVALGSASGLVSIDVDTAAGEEILATIAGGELPATAEFRTGKGRRLLFAIPDGLEVDPKTTSHKAEGEEALRFQGTGGQTVMPPSLHPSGRRYAWVASPDAVDVAAMPGWLVAEMCRPDEPKWADQAARDAFAEGRDFNRDGDWWADVLAPAGFKQAGRAGEVDRYTRPGKVGGISATVGHWRAKDGTPALYVFSGSIPELKANHAYDKFGAFARLHCAGDFQRAAEELVRRGFGKRKPAGKSPGASGPKTAAAGGNSPPGDGNGKVKTPWFTRPSCDPPRPGFTASDLFGREFQPPRFAIDGLLPEGLTILGGRPKQGKSWLALLLGWAVAGSYELDGRLGHPGPVLYLALEDTDRRLQGRLRRLQGGLGWEPPARLTMNTDWPRSPAGLFFIGEWLEARRDEPLKLVIVDTLARFREPQKGNGNSYAEDYAALGDLKRMLDHYQASGLVVHHTRKLRAQDPFDELSGTLGLSGSADTIWVLDRERGAESAKLYATGRDLADATVPLTWQKEHCRWVLGANQDGIDVTGRESGGSDQAATKLEQCKLWLLRFLAEYAYPSAEIMEAGIEAKFKPTTITAAKAALGRNGTQQVVHHNFGGRLNNDWWSGLGPVETWNRRPVGVRTGNMGPRDQETKRPRDQESNREIPD